MKYEFGLSGPLFRKQRRLVRRLADAADKGDVFVWLPGDDELLSGVEGLLDEIADQAHDKHGIDCLEKEA